MQLNFLQRVIDRLMFSFPLMYHCEVTDDVMAAE